MKTTVSTIPLACLDYLDDHIKLDKGKIRRALAFADLAHANQLRDHSGEPYITHVVRVANAVWDYVLKNNVFAGIASDLMVICLLHDVVEDTEVAADHVEAEFGAFVREGVLWLTNPSAKLNPKPPRDDRVKMNMQHSGEAPAYIKICKFKDRTDNLNDMPMPAGAKFFLKRYLPESRLLADKLRDADESLYKDLLRLIDDLEAKAVESLRQTTR